MTTTDKSKKVSHEVPIPPEYKNKRLICRVWDEKGIRTISKAKKITYGQPFFNVKIGKKDRLFKVNYNTEGMIKVIDGKMYYDTTFDNSVGGLSFHEFPEDMDSEEAYTIFKNNAINLYVKKGGIPPMVLYICLAVAFVSMIGIIVTVPSALDASSQKDELDKLATVLKQENAVLKQQVASLQSSVNNGG